MAALLILFAPWRPIAAQEIAAIPVPSETAVVPPITSLMDATPSAFRDVVERYSDDRFALFRRYDASNSPARRDRLSAFYQEWVGALEDFDFNRLGVEERIDYVLLNNELRYQLYELDREARLWDETAPLLPFADAILEAYEARRQDPAVDPRAAAELLERIAASADEVAGGVEASQIVGFRAAQAVDDLRKTLGRWYNFYEGYDPLFTWWAAKPYENADASLGRYAAYLRKEVVGVREGEDPPIIGDPIGAEAMRADLVHEMIPYTPEELIAIADREFAWCEAEMLRASRELGFGDDWQAALEYVKTLHVPPGEQPSMVRDLAFEAANFLKEHDLITLLPLSEEIWRIEMMSPERQKVNPFFTGGEVISVSFPTEGMEHEDKLMSMRGNNIHFARATVHHELLPGHHLQGFMTSRYNPHRRAFSTPFWGEGWALYWEMQLWDMDFPQTAEDRIGMLFWRMHRAARIIFSLRFHLGTMTPQEAIDFLVDRVGHERANATAEVRRSFNGSYPPLYQAAYMLGGLQIRALYDDLVKGGRMTNRQFHDAILQGGRMPIEMVRARLKGEMLPRDYTTSWRFAGDPLR